MIQILSYILLGMVTGAISGFIGIGGGILILPVLVLLFGLTQQEAQGTTLALLVPPIGLLAAWTYYKNGFVDLKMALFICIGFFIGGLLGSSIAVKTSNDIIQKSFGGVLLCIGFYMIIKK